MRTLLDYLATDHRACDDAHARADAAVSASDWDSAAVGFSHLRTTVLTHLAREEEILFPAFEAYTVNSQGPTEVMRMEHRQMRALLQELARALADRDRSRYLRLSKMFNALMQHHNLKEEDMLFPMFDRMLGEDGAGLVAAMRAVALA